MEERNQVRPRGWAYVTFIHKLPSLYFVAKKLDISIDRKTIRKLEVAKFSKVLCDGAHCVIL